MEEKITIYPIGIVKSTNNGFSIELEKAFIPALTGIEGFSNLQVVWWGNLYDKPEFRKYLVSDKPYKNGPYKVGVFATRSPVRPNPAGKYLRFIHKGFANKVGYTYKYIYTEFLPDTDYKLTRPFNYEYYGEKCLGPYDENSESEIYIPVE